jgi:hypothetical protein
MRFGLSRRWMFSLGAALGIVGMLLVVTLAMAQGPEAEGGVESLANVPSKISYQGVLKESGVPVTGERDFVFTLWTNDACNGGVAIWEGSRPNTEVIHGVFSVELDVPHGAFYGEGVWLGVQVDGTPIDCREILPVPYALGLKPGAEIYGEPTAWDGWVLQAHLDGYNPSATAIFGEAPSTGTAIRAESPVGYAVNATTNDGMAVRGIDAGTTYNKGYAGYFHSDNGVAVFGSVDTTASGSNSYAPAIWGESDDGVGVYGLSGPAIWKNIDRRGGVVGESDALYGVVGVSYDSAGVYGYSDNSYGGHFYTSSTATAVRAESDSGNPIEGWNVNVGADERVFRISNSGHCYIDGNYYGGGGVYMGSADFAEMVLPDQEDLGPGDVLVVGPEGRMIRSSEAYEPTVVGVYSTEPGFVGGNKLDEDGNPLEPEKIPLAIMGIVPVKAVAENGPIQPGDLLAASSTPGHAMRAGADPPVGTVIGKALEPLDEGHGLISMLVTLQ